MAFNPMEEKGTPLEKQIKPWKDANTKPYDKRTVDPYTRCRVILMNGIEVEAAIFKHQWARHTEDLELKRLIAATRRVEQQQQKMVNWLIPGDESNVEVTLGFEQVAVDLTAHLAKTEKNQHVKDALDFALLEDFDHLYRYANLYELTEDKSAEQVIGSDLTEIFPGRPTVNEHQHPYDTIRMPVDARTGDFLTSLHIETIVAAEQQTMNLYMNVGNRPEDMMGRGLYLEIAQIEEQHVSHYESLADATLNWFEMALLHEYNECFLYYSCMKSEIDERIKKVWEFNLDAEIDHLHRTAEIMREYGGQDPMEFLPDKMPTDLVIFKSNAEYVREVLAEQVDWTTNREEIVTHDSRPETYDRFQDMVNKGKIPSQEVIAAHIDEFGEDYRLEVIGEEPVERLRERASVVR